jgi:hypothetical protein
MSRGLAILELENAKITVQATPTANLEQMQKQTDLLDAIDSRLDALKREESLQQQFAAGQQSVADLNREIAARDQTLAGHERLKKELSRKYGRANLKPGELSPADRHRYLASRNRQQVAQGERDALAIQKTVAEQKLTNVKADYAKFRSATRLKDAFPGETIDSVCVGCIQSRTNAFVDKQNRLGAASNVFPGQQSYGNCGIQSAKQIIEQKTGKKITEKDALKDALDSGDADAPSRPRTWWMTQHEIDSETGGTTYDSIKNILDRHGVPAEVKPATKENLADAIRDRKGVIATVDAGILWEKSNAISSKEAVQYVGGAHAVTVYDGEFDAKGELTDVYISDTGSNYQTKMPIQDFMDATNGTVDPGLQAERDLQQNGLSQWSNSPVSDNYLVVTKEPVW